MKKPKAAKVTGKPARNKTRQIQGPASKARKESAKQAKPDTIHLGHSLLT